MKVPRYDQMGYVIGAKVQHMKNPNSKQLGNLSSHMLVKVGWEIKEVQREQLEIDPDLLREFGAAEDEN